MHKPEAGAVCYHPCLASTALLAPQAVVTTCAHAKKCLRGGAPALCCVAFLAGRGHGKNLDSAQFLRWTTRMFIILCGTTAALCTVYCTYTKIDVDAVDNYMGTHQTTRRIGSNTRACSGGQLETTRSKKDIKDDAIKIMIMHRPSCVKFHRPVAQKSVALVGLIRVRRCRLSSLGIRQLHHTLDALQSLRAIAWRHSHISRRVSDTVHWQVSVCVRPSPLCARARARVEGYRRRGHRSGRGQGG